MKYQELCDQVDPTGLACVYEYAFTKNTVVWDIEGYNGIRKQVTVPLQLISYNQALSILGYDGSERYRAYELEMELHKFHVGVFIQEECPFNLFSIYEPNAVDGPEEIPEKTYTIIVDDVVLTPCKNLMYDFDWIKFTLDGKEGHVHKDTVHFENTPLNMVSFGIYCNLNEDIKKLKEKSSSVFEKIKKL
ncbi:hypothetical protein ZPAH1_orf00041 [Aeromonas phage ZPAH1]|nr:hypothetical protein ASwh1_410 [Aeromonas phage Aswh_1]QQG33803.1 hypothetical protein ZPAH1_orf00041 [Aeromonas phage ZPAH1]